MKVSLTQRSRSPAVRYHPSSLTTTKRAASRLPFSRLRYNLFSSHFVFAADAMTRIELQLFYVSACWRLLFRYTTLGAHLQMWCCSSPGLYVAMCRPTPCLFFQQKGIRSSMTWPLIHSSCITRLVGNWNWLGLIATQKWSMDMTLCLLTSPADAMRQKPVIIHIAILHVATVFLPFCRDHDGVSGVLLHHRCVWTCERSFLCVKRFLQNCYCR